MKIKFTELEALQTALTTADIQRVLSNHLSELELEFVQDMTHISPAAAYKGNMSIDQIDHIRDDLYRCQYSYDWEIAWTCSGTQESGRQKEKVRFTVSPAGEMNFRFIK